MDAIDVLVCGRVSALSHIHFRCFPFLVFWATGLFRLPLPDLVVCFSSFPRPTRSGKSARLFVDGIVFRFSAVSGTCLDGPESEGVFGDFV